MTAGFVIWTAVSLAAAGVGVWAWNAKKAAGFFAGVEPPDVKDVRKYNRAVAVLWFVYAGLLELLGLPLLFMKKGSPLFLLSILGTAVISIGLMAAYHRILEKHRREGKR